MVKSRGPGKIIMPGSAVSHATRMTKRAAVILLVMLGIGAFALFTGIADAAMQSIQLNSAASFPVDI